MEKCRLLVIEDDEKISDLVVRVAKDAGFDVRATHYFTEIQDSYDEFLPHIIVLDIVMPKMDGMEVLKLLHSRNSPSRIVILSGEACYRPMAGALADGYGLSIDANIAKPFRIAALRETLEKIRLSTWTSEEDRSLDREMARLTGS